MPNIYYLRVISGANNRVSLPSVDEMIRDAPWRNAPPSVTLPPLRSVLNRINMPRPLGPVMLLNQALGRRRYLQWRSDMARADFSRRFTIAMVNGSMILLFCHPLVLFNCSFY